MSGVRVLVGTRKGAFVLTSDGKREKWDVSGPHFAGWEIYHVKGSPVDPESAVCLAVQRLVRPVDPALQRRRQDLGAGRQQVRLRGRHRHAPVVRRHAAPVGVQTRLAPGTVAHRSRHGLRRRRRRGAVPHDRRRPDLAGTVRACARTDRESTGSRAPAACACTRSLLDPEQSRADLSSPSRPPARSAPTTAARPGSRSTAGCSRSMIPDPTAEVGHCVHRIAMHPSRPDVLFMQKHWDVMRSDDAGDNWHEVSGNLPTDFGFPIDVHAHEPETIYVVPIKSDSEHFPPRASCASIAAAPAATSGKPLTNGLPQSDCYVNVLRNAMAVDSLDPCGVYFGTTGGQVYGSATRGDQLGADRPRPAGRVVRRGADAVMIRVELPAHLRTAGASQRRSARSTSPGRSTQRAVLDALEARYPDAARHDPRPRHAASAGRSCGSSPASRICRTSRPTLRCPRPSPPVTSRFWSSGPWPAANDATQRYERQGGKRKSQPGGLGHGIHDLVSQSCRPACRARWA